MKCHRIRIKRISKEVVQPVKEKRLKVAKDRFERARKGAESAQQKENDEELPTGYLLIGLLAGYRCLGESQSDLSSQGKFNCYIIPRNNVLSVGIGCN